MIRKPRCPNGSRRNKKTGLCEPVTLIRKPRCPNGSRRNKKTGLCEPSRPQSKPKPKPKSTHEHNVNVIKNDRPYTSLFKQQCKIKAFKHCKTSYTNATNKGFDYTKENEFGCHQDIGRSI